MKKKSLKKLSLSRETVRQLLEDQLRPAVGAGTGGTAIPCCAITNDFGYTCEPSDFGWTC